MRVPRSVEKLLCSPLCLDFGCSPTLAKISERRNVLRSRRIQEDGPSLMPFNRHRSTASCSQKRALPVHSCAGIGEPSDAPRAAEISCGRNRFGARLAPPRHGFLPRDTIDRHSTIHRQEDRAWMALAAVGRNSASKKCGIKPETCLATWPCRPRLAGGRDVG